MRRLLAPFTVAAMLLTGAVSFAEESTAPVTVADTSSTTTADAPTSEGGGNALRAAGALLDKGDTTHRNLLLSFHLQLPWGYYYIGGFGLGVGARFAIPIVKTGFLPMLNDSFWIEFGVDTGYYFFPGFSFGLTIPAQAMWMFHLIKNLAVYAKLSFGLHLQITSYPYYGVGVVGGGYVYPFFLGTGGLGLLYNIGDHFALRAEFMFGAGSHVNLGISIPL